LNWPSIHSEWKEKLLCDIKALEINKVAIMGP
jgi:hypothetical protein